MLLGIKNKATDVENDTKGILKYIANTNITKLYLAYYFIGTVAINVGLALKMLMFTNLLNFSDSAATNYFLIVGLIADFAGILALKYFTPKNDYFTITIKFGIRFLAYMIVFLSNNVIMMLIAITWSILISTAYENKTDAPYINPVPNELQLTFANVKYAVNVTATALGTFLAGVMYEHGIQYMLGLSAFFMIFQIGIAYRLIYMRNHNATSKASDLCHSEQI